MIKLIKNQINHVNMFKYTLKAVNICNKFAMLNNMRVYVYAFARMPY
jgi:hypothetical protein